jgi:hypothetical protein
MEPKKRPLSGFYAAYCTLALPLSEYKRIEKLNDDRGIIVFANGLKIQFRKHLIQIKLVYKIGNILKITRYHMFSHTGK